MSYYDIVMQHVRTAENKGSESEDTDSTLEDIVDHQGCVWLLLLAA